MIRTKTTGLALRVIILGVVCALAMGAQGQSYKRHHSPFEDGDDFHFGYISGSVGYSMLQTTIQNAMPEGNVGGAVGIGYEFRNSGLWANIGVQMSFHRSSLLVDPYTVSMPGQDTQGKAVSLQYRVNQTDKIEWNYFDVPLLAGYYVRGFHIGAGIKISYALNPKTISSGTYNLGGLYDGYEKVIENVGHGFQEYEFTNTVKNQLKVGVSLIGEIGYDLLSSMPTRSRVCNVLKLAFYFEYGLNTQLRGWDGTPQQRVAPNAPALPTPATNVTINPYLNTFDPPKRAVPFFTGVKLTYMIGGSRTARAGLHHGCMCYN